MKALYPLVALILLAATPPCGTATGSSAGLYGFGPAPPSHEDVTYDGKVLTVHQSLGDRMLTGIDSAYDASTLTLLSSESHASCCGTYWHSTITRNPDGSSYDLESETTMPAPNGDDVYKESRPRWPSPRHAPIIVGGWFFVPWLRHATHASSIVRIAFDPLRVQTLNVSDAIHAPRPYGVPSQDKALLVAAVDQTTTLWYDPCTFTLDAYVVNGSVILRRALNPIVNPITDTHTNE